MFLFSISQYRELFPDIGNSNSRSGNQFLISGNNQFSDIGKWFLACRELIFRYREMCSISRYRELNSRCPKIATQQKHVTPPARNTTLPHHPLSTTAPSNTGPICLWRPSLRLTTTLTAGQLAACLEPSSRFTPHTAISRASQGSHVSVKPPASLYTNRNHSHALRNHIASNTFSKDNYVFFNSHRNIYHCDFVVRQTTGATSAVMGCPLHVFSVTELGTKKSFVNFTSDVMAKEATWLTFPIPRLRACKHENRSPMKTNRLKACLIKCFLPRMYLSA